jgi:hypothetical protein
MPSLVEEALMASVLAQTSDWFAAMPARVVAVDGATIDAQPLVRRKYADGTYTDRPVVPNVPFMLPAFGQGAIELEPAVGDIVLLVCASRSTDEARANGWNAGSPMDARRFSLSDSFAIPVVTAAPPVTTLRLIDGKVALGNASVDVVKKLYDLALALSTAVAGPFPLSINAQAATIATDLLQIKEP